MTDTTDARVRVIDADKGITSEMIADQVILSYDAGNPTGGGVSFHGREFLFVNGSYQPMAGRFDYFTVAVEEIIARCFAPEGTLDPVTGADLSKVSTAGVGVIVKAAYVACFNEKEQALKDFEARMAAAEADHPPSGDQATADSTTSSELAQP